MAAQPLLSPEDREFMRRHFQALKEWDRERRNLLRNQPNDPAANFRALDTMVERYLDMHGGPLVDDEKEDAAESRLARILSQR